MKNEMNPVVILKNVSKKYYLHHEKPTLTEKFINLKTETFTALDNINLTICSGEKIGIIGPNGSGKTTLLKIISGITTPTKGSVRTQGRIVSLIDLEAGFHPDLTGEQNIYLNGMLIGMRKIEIKKMIHEIISFADIGNFIDIPLFTYSEGMKLKLGFSIAVHANPEILILDEGLWAGDLKFQKSSSAKLKSLFKKNKTVIVVSHWLPYIKSTCDRVLLIKNGRITQDGPTSIIKSYTDD